MSDHESYLTEADRAPTALGFARAYYAGAQLAARHRPDDLHTRQRAIDAWKEYVEAARKAGLSCALPPADFKHEPD